MSDAIYYKTDEVAVFLRLSERTVKTLAEDQKLPGAIQIGKQWRFDRQRLEEYLGRKLPEPREGAHA